MKKLILLLLTLFTVFTQAQTTPPTRNAGGFGAGFTSNDMDPSCILEGRSTSKGFLFPRMTTTQRNAILTPANGLQIYNTTTGKFNYYNGTTWVEIGTGAGTTPTLPQVLTAGDRETVIVADGANHTLTLAEGVKYIVQTEPFDIVLNAGVFPDNTEIYVYNASGGNILISGSASIISTNIVRNNSLCLIKKIVSDDTWVLTRLESTPYTPAEIGLGNVNNTTDLNKPISTATQTALNNLDTSITSQFEGLKVKPTLVTALSSTNITLSGTPTVDGYTVAIGDRVIANGQTTTSQNGCYVVASGAWTRATDSNTATKLDKSVYFVVKGTTNGGKLFYQNQDFPSPGVSVAQWVPFLSTPTPTDLDALKRDGSNANANVNIGSYNIVAGGGTFSGDVTGNAIPTGSTSFVTKNYLDNQISGISWKQAVKCATTANISLSGTSNIDGVTIPAGTRILVKNQTTTTENGIYTSASGAWSRALDADTGAELETSTVAVTAGTINKNTQWTCTSTSITVGTTPIAYGQISGAGTYTNGTGIDLTANIFSLTSSVQSQLTNAIPYTGASSNVDLGGYNLSASRINGDGFYLQNNGSGQLGLYATATDEIIAVLDNVGDKLYKYANGHLTYNETLGKLKWDENVIITINDILSYNFATTSDLTTGLATKVDKVTGKGLSTEDYTTAEKTKVSNLSGTNSGDNAVNSLYSGLATSKQDALVSGTNIKTVNSTSLLGSGNVAVEPPITAGTTSQYYRGDKSFQTLDKTAVGLGNVDNTSDVNKPVSTAQAASIALKLNKSKYISVGYTQVTGVTAQTVVASLKIPAGTYASGESFEVILTPSKSTTAAAIAYNVYHDTSANGITNVISNAVTLSTTQRTGYLQRVLTIDGTTLRNSMPANASGITPVAGTTVGATTTFNPAVDNWITVTVNPSVVSESVGVNQITIRPL